MRTKPRIIYIIFTILTGEDIVLIQGDGYNRREARSFHPIILIQPDRLYHLFFNLQPQATVLLPVYKAPLTP